MLAKLRLLFGISVFWLSLSMLSDGINTLVLPILLLGQVPAASKGTVLGLISFTGLLLGMLVMPYAGAWSDRLRLRWGRRGVIGLGVLMVLISLVIFGGQRRLLFVILGYVLLQISASVAQAAQQGFIPDLVPPALRGRASGLKSFMDIGGAMVGFVLLGQLLGGGSATTAFLVLGGALLAGFLLTLLFVREPRQVSGPSIAPLPVPRNPYRLDLTRHRAFFWLIISRFLFLLGTYAVGRFLVYFISDRLGLQAAQASKQSGNLLAVLALVTVLGALPAGWATDRFGRKPVMAFGGIISALGIVLLNFASSYGLMVLFGMLMSIGSAAFASANWAMSADLAPKNQAGRFYGLLNIGTAGASAVAGLFGPMIDYGNSLSHGAGYTFLFLVAALVSVLSAVVLLNVVSQAAQAQLLEVIPATGVQVVQEEQVSQRDSDIF